MDMKFKLFTFALLALLVGSCALETPLPEPAKKGVRNRDYKCNDPDGNTRSLHRQHAQTYMGEQ